MKTISLLIPLILLVSCQQPIEKEEEIPQLPEVVVPIIPAPSQEPAPVTPPSPPSNPWKRATYGESIATWQCIYNGKLPERFEQFVILDLFEHGQSGAARVRKAGSIPIAYFSAHYENWRPDEGEFGAKIKKIGGWKGEWYVDWKDSRNQEVMKRRLDKAREWGFAGVDMDNVDGPKGAAYFPWLYGEAKKRGLAVGLKNFVEILPQWGDRVDFFVSEASSGSELTCYGKYGGIVVRMYYGRGAATPPFIFQIRNGLNGNRF